MDNMSFMLTIEVFLKKEQINFNMQQNNTTIFKTLPDNRIFSIPAYQREIRWAEKNAIILMEDLKASKKFLGTILLNESNNSNYEIIDGQQRISVLILILKAIEKHLSDSFKLCKFINKTYEQLFEVLELDFNEELIQNHENKDIYLQSDILEQRERFEIIWNAINNYINKMSPAEIRQFKDNLLYSEINIILANSTNSKIYVDYYLDLNDKSVKLDNIDILKANLFRIDYAMMSNEWASVQKSIKALRTVGLSNYSLPTFYYHYFACTLNKCLGYQLTDLKTDMKFVKQITIKNHTYDAGTNILYAITDQTYFTSSIKRLKELSVFLKNVYQNNNLHEIKNKLKSCGCDNDTIDCVIAIIATIIRIDDEVPKMLVAKYFLDILNESHINKNDVKIIFYIYVYSILFTLTSGKKESTKLIRIVLSADWKDKLKAATCKLWDDKSKEINYWKKITENGKITKTSGQYIHKHVIAIKEFSRVDLASKSISFNQNKLKIYLTSPKSSAEHFFINKSCKVTFEYGTKGKSTEITLPKSITKYISCPINYLYMDSETNKNLGNLSIKEKIEILSKKNAADFSSEKNYQYFLEAKKAFEEIEKKEKYPDLSTYTSKSKAEAAVRSYYNKHLITLMEQYVNIIKIL